MSVFKSFFSSHTHTQSSSDDSSTEDENTLNSKKSKTSSPVPAPQLPAPQLSEPTPEPIEEHPELNVDEDSENNEDDDDDDEDLSDSNSSILSSPSISADDSNLEGSDNDTEVAEEEFEFLHVNRPKCTWFALRELFYREHGLINNGKRFISGRNNQLFRTRVCGSLNVVERLELMYKLENHDGCVNSLNFSQDGRLLASGSDDRRVVLWNWASNTVARVFPSGHYSNVFQTKFYGGNNLPDIRMITSARDGLVRCHRIPSSGSVVSRTLFKHVGAVNRIAIAPNCHFQVLSAGEDGMVIHVDMRTHNVSRLVTVKENRRKICLYGIEMNPRNDEFCVYGQNRSIRIYDRRNTKKVCREYYPDDLPERSVITSAVYNHLGTELVASYSDQDIYLFDEADAPGHFQNRYRGHLNTQTIKGVNFFGAGSEFIVSGSDCSNIFFWDKKTGKIVQWMQGDETGAVNVLEPHPEFPILATSGIDNDVKIWVPSNEKAPELAGLEKCVRKNIKNRLKVVSSDHFDQAMYNLVVRHRMRR